jgi:hypothetical protein
MSELVNPYLQQRRLRWRNRIDDWRARPAEPLFHFGAIALLALLLAALVWSALGSVGAPLSAVLDARATTLAFVVLLLAWADSRRRLRRQRLAWHRGWLAAHPIAEAARRRALAARLARRVASAWLLLSLLWMLGRMAGSTPGVTTLAMLAAAAGGGAVMAFLGDRPRAPRPVHTARHAGTAGRGVGRIWRWQRTGLRLATAGRSLAPGLLLLLLLPMGRYPMLVALLLVLGALALAWAVAAWRRALQVIVIAAGWLAPQPWPAVRFLRAALPFPLALLGVATLLPLPLAVPLGAGVALAGSALVLMFGSLQLMAVAAGRSQPRRIVPWSLLHAGLLLACISALPPLAPLVWLLQIGWLTRRALQ